MAGRATGLCCGPIYEVAADLLTFSLKNIFALLQQMSVFLVIASLLTKSP